MPHFETELQLLVDVLPERLQATMSSVNGEELLEIVLDLGRPPEARLAERTQVLDDEPVGISELEHVLSRVGPLGNDNRAGIERTLHRVSAIRNRAGRVVGLTLRVGRAVFGTIDMLRDLVESGRSILLLGRPGVGKTTKLREIARVLAEDVARRVMVVDTSNEIGGDGDIPHPGIGHARRMQVARPELQHAVMIEAVENHMPEVIIVDEIGTEAEALAARTIAERGVQLVATAHGNTLENLVLNPTLSDLVGGVHVVTLSDEEARRRGTLKTVSERRAPPTFDVVVEMPRRDEVLIHPDTGEAVDALLAGRPLGGERRAMGDDGRIEVSETKRPPLPTSPVPEAKPERRRGPLRVHAYGVGRELLEKVLRDIDADARVVNKPENADVLLALRTRAGEPRFRRAAEASGATIHILKRASGSELRRVLRNAFLVAARGLGDEEVEVAMREAERGVAQAVQDNTPVELPPRPPRIRRLQHRLVAHHHLEAVSSGTGGERHLVIHPPAGPGDEPELPPRPT
ncbi:MAG: R3H domain-containing nucleic acid-binding protein [Myxococcaceae bacterium]